ncbi:hypothetical protein LZC95_52335 [Pendulispora brunnea]|uniref:Uncharacterized protein n=1 Tax=Pendulispora brunnea TaxID=2905690 RepID=A0ABZ2KA98_9BACT
MADEADRTRLIGEISRVIREPATPESTRTAGLTLIGWLARRMPGEKPHALGVAEARESERRLVAMKELCPDRSPERDLGPETQASPKSTLRIARRRSR